MTVAPNVVAFLALARAYVALASAVSHRLTPGYRGGAAELRELVRPLALADRLGAEIVLMTNETMALRQSLTLLSAPPPVGEAGPSRLLRRPPSPIREAEEPSPPRRATAAQQEMRRRP